MVENLVRCMIRLYDPKMCYFLVILLLFNEVQMIISRKQFSVTEVLWSVATSFRLREAEAREAGGDRDERGANIPDFFLHKIEIYSGTSI